MQWSLFENPSRLATQASLEVLACARQAVEARGAFHLVLAGGKTPQLAYGKLASETADWPRWHLYFGDERCLPAGNAERNSEMARRSLTGCVPIPSDQLHPIPAEKGPEAAAREYEKLIEITPEFDLVILGLGEDGHTASLFPDQPYDQNRLVIPVIGAPKPPSERVSLTPLALANSREILFLVTGAEKRAAVGRWRRGDPIPVNRMPNRPADRVFVERSAWSETPMD